MNKYETMGMNKRLSQLCCISATLKNTTTLRLRRRKYNVICIQNIDVTFFFFSTLTYLFTFQFVNDQVTEFGTLIDMITIIERIKV